MTPYTNEAATIAAEIKTVLAWRAQDSQRHAWSRPVRIEYFDSHENGVEVEVCVIPCLQWDGIALTGAITDLSKQYRDVSSTDMEEILSAFRTGSRNISESAVPLARAAGLSLHHEVEVQECDDGETVVTRDDWYAATPEFVIRYYGSGGTWGYDD